MRKLPAIAVLLLLFIISGCGSKPDATDYLSLPFESEARITIDSSEYLVNIKKGGANLISVTVDYPEALRGMTVSLGEESALIFRGMKADCGFPRSVAELIYDAFDAANTTEVFSDGATETVRFSSPRGRGSICVDGFSSVPISLESGDVYIEFTDFQR